MWLFFSSVFRILMNKVISCRGNGGGGGFRGGRGGNRESGGDRGNRGR